MGEDLVDDDVVLDVTAFDSDVGERINGCACGEQFANVNCAATAEGAVWTLGSPLSCGACESYGAEADCGTDPSCQWLTPGCSGEPIVTGCYPVQGCDVTPCGENLTCVERSYNPCHNKLCDGCGGSYFTCVAE